MPRLVSEYSKPTTRSSVVPATLQPVWRAPLPPPTAAALLAFRDALSGWNEAVRSNGIQLVGWQAAGRGAAATAADAAGGNGSIASAGVCSWSSVVCDAHGRVEEL